MSKNFTTRTERTLIIGIPKRLFEFFENTIVTFTETMDKNEYGELFETIRFISHLTDNSKTKDQLEYFIKNYTPHQFADENVRIELHGRYF